MKYRFAFLGILLALDTVTTLQHFHLEKNPVVIQLGPKLFILHHIVIFVLFAIVWYIYKPVLSKRLSYVANSAFILLCIFYSVVVSANLTVYLH